MSWINKDIFDRFWDLRDLLTTDLITSPIRWMIDRDAKRAGIDLCNPRRSVASLLGSCGMGAALGAVLGPPGGILGGLLGYVVSIGSDYEGDRLENACDDEEAAIYILELKAFQIAAETTQDRVSEETWAEICEEVEYEFDILSAIHDPTGSLEIALAIMFEAINEGIRRVDLEAHYIFSLVYDQARQGLGL